MKRRPLLPTSPRRRLHRHRNQVGITLLEILFVVAVGTFLILLLMPSITARRETARRQTCQNHLRTLTLALQQYQQTFQHYPPAAHWDVNSTASLALHRSRRIDQITRTNWAQLLLPFLEEHAAAKLVSPETAIGDPSLKSLREMHLSVMTCPSDDRNRSGNRYRFSTSRGKLVEFARGNYAINGGTHNYEIEPPTTSSPQGDFVQLEISDHPRRYSLWGNGIAGINRSFHLDDFVNGTSTLIALEEIRAGIHPVDPRGVWSLGQIGGSLTWGHGVNGDDAGPNNSWIRADDILGCPELHRVVGSDELANQKMPCVDYVDANQQATARSRHPEGVYVAFLDGHVEFLSDHIDRGLWHVLHSRETPQDVFKTHTSAAAEAVNSSEVIPQNIKLPLTNSLGMTFVRIPAGRYLVGIPDQRNSDPPLPDSPPHEVELSVGCLLGTHEVTRQQFSKVMGTDACPPVPEIARDGVLPPVEEEHLPITNITWHEAVEFCNRLSEIPTEQTSRRRYRLPTEAEWEIACRCGSDQPYDWKKFREEGDLTGEAAGMIPPLPLRPVGSFFPNGWGLADMRGNAWEWTSDWFQREIPMQSIQRDPEGPPTGFLKVVRGGDWRYVGETCRIDSAMLPPWKRNPAVGFRVVCEIISAASSAVADEQARGSVHD